MNPLGKIFAVQVCERKKDYRTFRSCSRMFQDEI